MGLTHHFQGEKVLVAILATVSCQAWLRTARLPVGAIEIPRILHEAVIPGKHACVEAVHVSGRTQGLTLVPPGVACGQDTAEGFVTAVGTDDQVGASVDAIDAGSARGMKVGAPHEKQYRHQVS